MKPSILYRIASVLLVLFALGHTLGFRQLQPEWNADSVVASMRAVHFEAQGFNRTYWDFYSGFGLFVSVFFIVHRSALVADEQPSRSNVSAAAWPRVDAGAVLRSTRGSILALLFCPADRIHSRANAALRHRGICVGKTN